MADEPLDIWDADGKPTGVTMRKSEAHAQGLWHPTAHVWLFTKNGDVLFQKRSPTKDIFPDMYDVSCGGHVDAGESPLQGIVRELQEELGIQARENDLVFIERFSFSTVLPGWKRLHNEHLHVFFSMVESTDIVITFAEDEIAGVRWFSIDAVRAALAQSDHEFASVHGYLPMILGRIETHIKNH